MPVGTQGVVKATTPRDLVEVGASIILGNTYHLHLRPGDELIRRRGGLHRFIGWDRPILTDSGGYQVFSLADRRTLSDEGVEFQSHLDGSRHLLTPESAADIQLNLGSDIAMVLDECPALPAPREALGSVGCPNGQVGAQGPRALSRAASDVRTRRRPAAVRDRPGRHRPGTAGRRAPGLTLEVGFDGYAIGGLSVGEPSDVMYKVIAETAPRASRRTGRAT